MFGLFKKREPEKKEEAPTVVVEVPIQPTTCIQPSEHAMLAKVRALQVEREEIKAFLSSDPQEIDRPEIHKMAGIIAAKTLSKVDSAFHYHSWHSRYSTTEDWLNQYWRIIEEAIPAVIPDIDLSAVIAEAGAVERQKAERKQKKARLEQIEKEIMALKKSLGISE